MSTFNESEQREYLVYCVPEEASEYRGEYRTQLFMIYSNSTLSFELLKIKLQKKQSDSDQ